LLATRHPEVEWLQGLRAAERARFLARLAFNLTISGRAVAISCATEARRLEQLRQLNEIQHRVMGYSAHALAAGEDTRWLAVVAKYVLEPADAQLREATMWAWKESRDRLSAPRPSAPESS
jgi:hypothetical protein